ncbi:MAG TPA: hypothetical protein VJS44_21585 [Pyrinomonadaceae bacterium]|nr:hypothetical protein [Pyrinomonadaceae bacterium]
MAEEKILIPAYKRAASCERCGADVYAPEVENRGDWPLMSACACAEGPQLRARGGAEDLRRGREQKPVERAQAA